LPIKAGTLQNGRSGPDALKSGQTQWPVNEGVLEQSGQVMQLFLTGGFKDEVQQR
jgi:hypothetical protein